MKVLLYWLLLLVPTVLLGIFGWQMLRQEEARLAESAELARRERANIVAENLTLFLEEARSGIIAGLSEVPPGDPREALEAWAAANPLVRQTFLWRPHAGVILPLKGPAESQTTFLRRYDKLLSPRPQWEPERSAPSPAPERRSLSKAEPEIYFDQASPSEQTPRQELKQIADDARLANYARQSGVQSRAEAEVVMEENTSFHQSAGASRPVRRQALEAPRVSNRGWIPFLEKEPLSAIAWVELQPGGEIRGAEVDLEAVTSRMLAVLPRDGRKREFYRLIDHTGSLYSSQDPVVLAAAAPRLDVSPLLPGWQLVADSSGNAYSRGGRGFFLLSSLLLGVLLAAIVSGGSMLLYQAHRHQVDARQKSSFVSNVSHELKTPLTTIRMYAELIGEGRIRDEARHRNYLNVIIAESQRLTRLINNVLDFSRLEQAQKCSPPAETISLRKTVLPILEAQEMRLQQAGIALHREFPTEDTMITAEPDAVEQALLNLLDNAIKYAAAGGELVVSASEADDTARIHFMDRGPGIEQKQERHLFDKFFRGDTSLTARQPGCGLGLNIAQRLVRRFGGDLTFSAREGGGACFTIILPLADHNQDQNPQREIASSHASDSHR